jgi:3-oxoacyl-[acyl-carrier protein] reductase
MGRLEGKAAIVTGGGGLLGAAFCKQMAAEGARVLVNDIAGERADSVVAQIQDAGGKASAFEGSVDSWERGGRIAEACVERFGRIDCLVNAAHTTSSVPLMELEEETFRTTLDSHVTGHFACTHHCVRQMVRQGEGGSVVNLISRAMQGMRGLSAYGAAKGAILSATFSWALELAEHRIRVNAISPAARRREPGEPISQRMPWRREPGQSLEEMRAQTPTPESVAPLVVFLASEASDWISGQGIFLAGDSLALIRHPREDGFAFMPEGWSIEQLEQHFRHCFGVAMERPSMQAAPYAWHDGVGPRRASPKERPQR